MLTLSAKKVAVLILFGIAASLVSMGAFAAPSADPPATPATSGNGA
jgi:hypothetical protein